MVEKEIDEEVELPALSKVDYPDEAFHMVTQVQWEDDVIWSGEESRQKITTGQKQRSMAAGWIPSSSSRTAEQFIQQGRCPLLLILY